MPFMEHHLHMMLYTSRDNLTDRGYTSSEELGAAFLKSF